MAEGVPNRALRYNSPLLRNAPDKLMIGRGFKLPEQRAPVGWLGKLGGEQYPPYRSERGNRRWV
ncbi:MAG: hypothetical protein RL571_1597 [Pseudomonadota bacterium]|jgi:hypothetical protein